MNAIILTHATDRLNASLAERSPLSPAARAARGLIAALVCQYENYWTELERAAVTAAELGFPSYWSTATYSQSTQRVFALAADKDGLQTALRFWVDRRHPSKTASALLASLVPLNSAGAGELQHAKAEAYWADAPGAPPC